MNHEQLLSRNAFYFAEMISVFQELNRLYLEQFTLYLDSDGWELFDIRVGRSIIRHEFRHYRQFIIDMRSLHRTMSCVAFASLRLQSGKLPKPHESRAISKLSRIYSLDDEHLFSTHVQSYYIHGINKKTETLADCD